MAPGNVTFWNKLTIALEIEYLLDDERYENAPPPSEELPTGHGHFVLFLPGTGAESEWAEGRERENTKSFA